MISISLFHPFPFLRKEKMERKFLFLVATLCLLSGLNASNWNILNQKSKYGLKISLKNYCESWRMNIELNNIRDFKIVPEECAPYIGKYMTGTQYKVDSEGTIEECTIYLSTSCNFKKDGKDAWIFDIDDTLLSTVPYFKQHNFGGEQMNFTSLEEWMSYGKATALKHSLSLFNDLKGRGIEIFLVSSRREILRSATIDNLVNVGFYGWASLHLRGEDDECKTVQQYKSEVRNKLMGNGYRIWGIVGDQWSSIQGLPFAKRTFKLPNPLYHVE